MIRLASALLLASCAAAPPQEDAGVPDAGPMLTAFQQAVLSAHNAVRSSAMPVPSPALPEMSWSPRAQALAEDWAARCDFNHRDPNTLGENLFASTRDETPASVINGWAAERADYTLSTNTCAAGRQCGHYTQIVWRSSTGVGCATQRCTTGSPFSGSTTWYFFVCDYDPAGNFIGQAPY